MAIALNWKEITPGWTQAVSREPIAIYEISEVQISKRKNGFQVQVLTETGAYDFPRSFRTLRAAQQACTNHRNHWRREIAQALQMTRGPQ